MGTDEFLSRTTHFNLACNEREELNWNSRTIDSHQPSV
jgi:hypothetical protein